MCLKKHGSSGEEINSYINKMKYSCVLARTLEWNPPERKDVGYEYLYIYVDQIKKKKKTRLLPEE